MGFKTQKVNYYIVKEEGADKKETILNKRDKFALSESQIRDLTNGQIPIEMWKKLMNGLIGEDNE